METCTNLVLCDNLEGWDGRKAQEAGVYINIYNYDWFMLMYSRNHNIVKQLSSN